MAKATSFSTWRQMQPAYQDHQTGLPTALGQYRMMQGASGWSVVNETDAKLADGLEPFAAYRVMLDAYEAQYLSTQQAAVVYFIGPKLAFGEPVKIGRSVDPKSRLRTLQTGYHEPLSIFAVAPGGAVAESAYHQKFAGSRLRNEWFSLNFALIDEIRKLGAFPLPTGGPAHV